MDGGAWYADRLAVAVRGRGVGALREVTANIPEGSGGEIGRASCRERV